MIDVKAKNIDIENSKLNCTIEYPAIYIEGKNSFLEIINNNINEEINIFLDIGNESFKTYKKKSNVIVDYKIHFNKNNIMSLSILFSEIYKHKDLINYVSTYNFDLNKEQIINIQDLFKKEYEYKSIIRKILEKNIYEIQNFYIKENSINLVYSSYEIYNTKEIIEKEIKFKDIYNYLSEYTIQRIMGE
ncbi:hypothetical protein UT300013_23230 [Paraclostridium sordellii]